MSSKKVMKLIDTRYSIFECQVCGRRKGGNIKDGKWSRGTWQCVNGCEK